MNNENDVFLWPHTVLNPPPSVGSVRPKEAGEALWICLKSLRAIANLPERSEAVAIATSTMEQIKPLLAGRSTPPEAEKPTEAKQ